MRLCFPRRVQSELFHGASINNAFRRKRPSELYELFRNHEDITFNHQLDKKADLVSLTHTFLAEKTDVLPSQSEEETRVRAYMDELDIFTQANWGVLLEDCSAEQIGLLQRKELRSELTSGLSLTADEFSLLPNHLSDDLVVTKDMETKDGLLSAGSEVCGVGRKSVNSKKELMAQKNEPIEFRTIGGALQRQLYGTASIPVPLDPKAATPMTANRRQFLIERKGFADSVREFREVQEMIARLGLLTEQKQTHAIWITWATQMIEKIKAAQETGDIPPFLSPDVLSVVTCKAALNTMLAPKNRDREETSLDTWKKMELGEMELQCVAPVATLCTAIGEAANFEWNCKTLEEKIKKKDVSLSETLVKQYREAKKAADRRKMLKQLAIFHNQSWDEFEVRVPMGAKLLQILIETAKVEVDYHEAKQELDMEHQKKIEASIKQARYRGKVPDENAPPLPPPQYNLLKSDNDPSKVMIHAFYHRLLYKNQRTFGQVAMRLVAAKALCGDWGDLAKCARAVVQPMIRKPEPWQNVDSGAYLVNKVKFVRHHGVKTIDDDFRCYDNTRVTKVMDIVSGVPWKINKRIVDYIEYVRANDLQIAGIPAAEDEVVPEKKSYDDFMSLSKEEQQKAKLEMLNIIRNNEKLSSARPTLHLKMQVAHNFYHAERFYFPHNVDYRGRAYPLPPHLNHQGDDVSRGILMFADGRPLGEEGVRWMKIALANLYGMDKLTFDQRLVWTDEHIARIQHAARDPFNEEALAWWTKASDGPWQFLARCIDFNEALESGNPEAHVSHLPVYMDGSCNGLQHYAALGRDEWGARSVNVVPSETVQDVYVEVLQVVKGKVAKDATKEIKGPNARGQRCVGELSRLAQQLGVLERKTVKQTVMTICYGVTSLGAKDQVRARLIDKVGTEIDPKVINDLARYLSRVVLDSIGEVFKQAMQIKSWFDQVSAVFNKTGTTVCWMSPLGFAVRQPYYENSTRVVKTAIQNIHLAKKNSSDKVKKSSQRSGFPPNFVHSLDATHMMMAAERCHAEGVQFASVHDSFWTHASDVTRMNAIIRETFVELYSKPILQDLDRDLRTRLGVHAGQLPPLPPQGNLDIKRVLDSPYFFD